MGARFYFIVTFTSVFLVYGCIAYFGFVRPARIRRERSESTDDSDR